MSIVARDKVFSKSNRIYLNDPDFLLINNQYVQFIDFFSTEKLGSLSSSRKGGRIIVNISADSDYVLFINGKQIAFGQTPTANGIHYYDSLDITEYAISNGINKLAVLLYFCKSAFKEDNLPGLIFEVKYYAPGERAGILLLSSAPETQSRIAAEYSMGEIPKVSEMSDYTFEYDSTVYDGWEKTEYIFPKNNRSRITWQNSSTSEIICKYSQNPLKKIITGEPTPAKILAQGLFDYGNEYRTTHKKSPAAYMQTAAMIAKPFSSLASEGNSLLTNGEHTSKTVFTYNFSENSTNPTPDCKALYGKGIYVVLDLMYQEHGHIFFDIKAPVGTVVNIAYGDDLNDLRVRSYTNDENRSCSYICNGARSFFAHFLHKIHGRYLQIFAECDSLTLYSFGILPSAYPFCEETQGTFTLSDALHNKIYQKGIHCIKHNTLQYLNNISFSPNSVSCVELRNYLLCNYYCLGDYILSKTILSQISGHINSFTPEETLYWLQIFADYVLYSGDTDFAVSMFPLVSTTVQSFIECCQEYSVLKNVSPKKADNILEDSTILDADLTALLVIALERTAQTYAFVASSETIHVTDRNEYIAMANEYMNHYEQLRNSFNNIFFDAKKGLYASFASPKGLYDYSKHTNSLAIYAGISANNVKVQSEIAKYIKAGCNAETLLIKSPLPFSIYMYEALLLCNSENISYVMQDIENIYGNSLFTETFFENIDMSYFSQKDDNIKRCFTIPIFIYYKYILGLRPTRPGFSEYQCLPRQYNCHTASGTVVTPSGRFSVVTTKDQYSCKKTTV